MSPVQEPIETVNSEFRAGDLLEFDRGLYSHWSVFIDRGKVVHLAGGEGMSFKKAVVRIDNLLDVVGNDKVHINNKEHLKLRAYNPEEIVQRALSKVGREGYNLVFSNCEHFATWCRYGIAISDQASILIGLADLAVVAVANTVIWLLELH